MLKKNYIDFIISFSVNNSFAKLFKLLQEVILVMEIIKLFGKDFIFHPFYYLIDSKIINDLSIFGFLIYNNLIILLLIIWHINYLFIFIHNLIL